MLYKTYICCLKTPTIITLPKILDERGNLSVIEQNLNIPFEISRLFWIYDVPGGEKRGGHAYHDTEEFIVALSGSFDVVIFDGDRDVRYSLNRSYYGLFVPRMFWRHMENFSTNSLALILANRPYADGEYIRDLDQYRALKNI